MFDVRYLFKIHESCMTWPFLTSQTLQKQTISRESFNMLNLWSLQTVNYCISTCNQGWNCLISYYGPSLIIFLILLSKYSDISVQLENGSHWKNIWIFYQIKIDDFICKFRTRTSNHILPIETGRWQGIERQNRTCNYIQYLQRMARWMKMNTIKQIHIGQYFKISHKSRH
jgi:hypothetical protein